MLRRQRHYPRKLGYKYRSLRRFRQRGHARGEPSSRWRLRIGWGLGEWLGCLWWIAALAPADGGLRRLLHWLGGKGSPRFAPAGSGIGHRLSCGERRLWLLSFGVNHASATGVDFVGFRSNRQLTKAITVSEARFGVRVQNAHQRRWETGITSLSGVELK